MGIDPHTQPNLSYGTQEKGRRGAWYYILSLSLWGLYANVAVNGFQYPSGADYNFFLPMANWFRDRSLYPGDPLRDVFPHVQTFYWPAVAMLSRYYGTEHILFALFLITKLIFFGGVGRLIETRVRSHVLGACMVTAIALSGMLNGQTPVGGTIILDEISEPAALGLAIALLACVLLIERKWRSAAIAAGLIVYVDALHFVHILPAFALFATIDWREHKRQIISAAVLGAGVFLPWFVHFHGSYLTNYPSDYVSVLLIHYPLHITLRWTPISQLLQAATLLSATACMCLLARRAGLKSERRLELLAVSYLMVMLVGILAGWFWLTPDVARFMLARADSLLIPFAFLLLQFYGASLLDFPVIRRPAGTALLAVIAILSPLCIYVTGLMIPAVIFWLGPPLRLERYLAPVFKRFSQSIPAIPLSRIVAVVCVLGILGSFFFLISSVDQLWNFQIPATPEESACFEAQLWARDHTPREARFLVPPEGCGFRILSQRSSWGEWSDGNAMYFYPVFAGIFRERVAALDPAPVPQGADFAGTLTQVYKQLQWDRIRAVANNNRLDYILQFRSTQYPGEPVYANEGFAIYKAR